MMRIYLIIYSMFFAVSTIAADLSVMPVGLKLTTGHDRDAITITNQGQETVVMQLETVSWEQVDGRDIYQPTQNLLVNPPLFTMAPGQTQILRVGLRQPLNNEQEIAYRLFLREVPSQLTASEDNNANGNIRVLLQLRLPVYVVPKRIVQNQQWRGHITPDGRVLLTVSNLGNVHQVVNEIKLRYADVSIDSPSLATIKDSVAILPKQSHQWELHPTQKLKGHNFMLEVGTDQDSQHVALDLDQL